MALHQNRGKTMEVNDQAEAVRNNYRRQGATAERERIIKLLEARRFELLGKVESLVIPAEVEQLFSVTDGFFQAIALIKGEQE